MSSSISPRNEIPRDKVIPKPLCKSHSIYEAFIACQPPLSKLSDIVQKFITDMILCPNCDLPELIFEVEPGIKV